MTRATRPRFEATTGVPDGAAKSAPACGERGLPLMMRREPKLSALPAEATGRVNRPRQSRSELIGANSVRGRAASASARRSFSGERSTMEAGRLKRWTENLRALIVIVPALLRA